MAGDHTREFDVVVWGASGFTGRLVATHLLRRHGIGRGLCWALGGRNRTKLETVRAEIARETGVAGRDLPLVVGDADDQASMDTLAARTRVVCTTVGPYARHGSTLVAACVRAGTDCCDLAGEVQWMRRMIDAHERDAKASGARIVHTCGFDSIPSDLGVFALQREMRARHGVAARRVKLRVKGLAGGASGGTVASILDMLEEAGRDPAVRRILADPYALNPDGRRSGPDAPDRMTPAYDDDFASWIAPFVMAGLNTRVVRRTAALLCDAYGPDFRYDEAMLTGSGPAGFLKAGAIAVGLGGLMAAGRVGPLRRVLARFAPEPGEGPSKAEREAGWFDLRLQADHPTSPAARLLCHVTGDRDPGYGSTAKMLGEAAVCLASDVPTVTGGFWTPASAMGAALVERLRAHAGVEFAIEDGPAHAAA